MPPTSCGGSPATSTRAATAVAVVVDTLVEAMSDHRSDERVAVGGTANLARFGDSFDTAVRPLLEALEEHVVLLKLIGEATIGGTVTVRIGPKGPTRSWRDQRGRHRLRPRRRGARDARHRGSDPHGLPGIDGGGARGRPLRLAGSSTRPERRPAPRTRRRNTREPGPLRPSGVPATRTATPSRRPTAGWRGSCTPTSTPTRRPRSSSRRSRAPTRCCRPAEAGGVRPRRRPVRRCRRLRPGCGVLLHRHHGRLLRRRRAGAGGAGEDRGPGYAAGRTR